MGSRRIRILPYAFLLGVAIVTQAVAAQAAERQRQRRPAVALPPTVEMIADVVYREADGRKLLLDIYRPKQARTARPVVIMIHGGAWRGGDKRGFRRQAIELATKGYAAVSVNYRLLPEIKGMEMLEDVQCAIRWVRKNARRYNFDPARIGLVGGSAGGHLVALAATYPDHPCPEPSFSDYAATVTCVVDFFGPSDLRLEGLGGPVRQWFARALSEDPRFFDKFSPVEHVSPRSPPFLILHGEGDRTVPIEQSEILKRALERAGVEVELVRYPKAPHGFINYRPRSRRRAGVQWPYRQAWNAAHRFFAKHLRPEE